MRKGADLCDTDDNSNDLDDDNDYLLTLWVQWEKAQICVMHMMIAMI